MARYCSAQDNVRTRQSPPYRETIRVNVLHGRKSMSWAKSVLPLFTGTSSETLRKVPDRVQIDTTLNRQNRVQNHPFIGRHRLLNRTAVAQNGSLTIIMKMTEGLMIRISGEKARVAYRLMSRGSLPPPTRDGKARSASGEADPSLTSKPAQR